ncbi:hypothetical protein MJG53_010756 [Ovis ammon polii x Ovis aries]|uniref:Uncharacterized protein n=1 Tax=Ovis ammon polii x Ovis aries TaxID=2918886 RepID=A0ACB9UV24_9CETA|nr:hypothetical protein MJG53_010756 [Ovis ammon polii x Ovis aries]
MRPSRQLALAGLLVFSLIPSQLCQMHALTQVKKKKMEEKTTESRKQTGLQAGTWKVCIGVNETNFWHIEPLINTMLNAKYTERFQDANVLLTFRLVGIKSQRLEQQLSGQIKEDINSREAHSGNPLTNYYQLSLALLALCLFNGRYSITSVTYYFTPENKNYYFEDQFSVDTGAMAVLALTCVRRDTQRKMGASTQRKISGYIASLANKIQAEGKQGLLGNVFSTGEAMQGVFYLPIAAAQILPALMGKTYLDVISPSCGHNPVKFNVSTEKPDMATPTTAPLNILVKYSVRVNKTSHTQVTVRKGSVFLDVMKAAQEKNEALFRFTVEETSWGPFVTSVQGISASSKDRTYWKLLSNGQPLTQVSSVGVTGAGRLLCKRYLTMLSWVVLSAAAAAAPSLKNAAFLGPGVLQATRIFHTGQPSLAPVPPLPEHGGKVHFGLIPEEFFQFLYPKTGVTGPYVLGTGLILYLLSKEIYVITPETASAISTIGFLVYVVEKYGASVGEFADKLNEQKIAQLEEVKQASIKQIQDAIDMEKSQQALVQKRHYLFDVQRNNIAMALEVTYRERLHRVYREVKNCLDYHISVQNMMRQKEQEHMINWVEKHVVQSIPAQQEKETIAKCIADLKLLAKKAQAQPVM